MRTAPPKTTGRPGPPPPGVTPLTENQWKDGSLAARINDDWYSFPVTDGTQYFIWRDDAMDIKSNKTGRVSIQVFNGDGTQIWSQPYTSRASFYADGDGTVYVRIYPRQDLIEEMTLGTYGVVYSTDNTRP